ncbi:MAG TPA: peptidylprolyl isomerase [Actinomycetota bacterium]|nr:peptidylprolyl isomerase [Actinomycetota bacterium]
MKPVRRLFPLALPLLVALVAASCSRSASPPATVSGTDITDAQVAAAAGVFQTLFGLQRATCGEKTDAQTDTDAAACNRYALGALIEYRLAEGYAAANGISISDADVQQQVGQIRTSLGSTSLDAQLATHGATAADLSNLVRLSALESKVAEQITLGKIGGEAGLRGQYQDRLAEFTVVQVDNIVVKTQAEAEQVYRQVTQPGSTEQDFLNLAKQVSIDPTAKQNSGSISSTTASQFPKPFADAVVTLQPGEISKPVHSTFGWHVIRMVTKQVTPYAKARPQLLQDAEVTAFGDWLRSQVDAGQVDVNPSFGRYDRSALQVVRITSTEASGTPSASPSATISP